jgi:hypothetical protein
MAEKIKYSHSEETKILELAKKRFDRSVDAFSPSYTKAIEMLKFKHGEQWSTAQKKAREAAGRPTLTINEMSKFSRLICGEMRRNKVQIKASPASKTGSRANAEVIAGLLKNIEYQSSAETIYDHAGKMLVDCGFAAGRVLSRYTNDEDDPFLQELYFEALDNPFSVHPDPDAKDSRFYSDGEFLFIDSPMLRADFIEEYGEDAIGTVTDSTTGTECERWYDNDSVIVREYFYKEYKIKKMVRLSDGQNMEKGEAEKFIANTAQTLLQVKADQDTKRTEAMAANIPFDEQEVDPTEVPTIVKERSIKIPHIKWLKITATKILEANEWPGTLIPVAFATGEYTNIAGERRYDGLFKDSMDPQRLINNSYTSLWEIVSLMPKAPWQATAKMIEGYETDYLAANAENFPILKYKKDNDFPGQKPERTYHGANPTAMYTILQECKQNLKDSVGMYNADVGDQGPEVSGKAILARQAPGDTSTYIYHDNRAGFVAQLGKIANDALPGFYDTERDVGVRGFNGKSSTVPINTTVAKVMRTMQENPERYSGIDKKAFNKAKRKGIETPFNNIAEGKYEVFITTGPAYQTQRQEAAENIMKTAQVAGKIRRDDLWHLVNTLDFPGAEEWADSIRKSVPPGVLPEQEDVEPPQPQPPSPEDMLAAAKLDLEKQKLKNESIKMQVEIMKLQNQISQSKESVNAEIINKLEELMSPVHPADMAPPQLQQQGGQ